MPSKKLPFAVSICDAITENDFTMFIQQLGTSRNEMISNAMTPITDTCTNNKLSPYLLCTKYARFGMLQYVLNIGGIDVNQQDDNGHNALAHLVLGGKVENSRDAIRCVKQLFTRPSFNLNAVDNFNRSALLLAAADERQFEIIKLLLKHKQINVTQCDHSGSSAIMDAAMHLHATNVRLLLRHCANVCVNDTNNRGRTALFLFACYDHGDVGLLCARQLLDHPDTNLNYVKDRDCTALTLTASRKKFLTHALLTHGKI
jgi:hypothetical protein